MRPPELTAEQRAAAIERSALARQQRSELRERLRDGRITLSAAIAAAKTDQALGKMKVLTLLESMPGVGPVRARSVMADVGIAESRRIRGLGPKQVEGLCRRFG